MHSGFRVAATLFLLLSAAVFFVGCGAEKSEKTEQGASFAVIHDDMGREVVLSKKPERIVALSASFLDPLHAVGGDVVGRPDSKTKMPDYAKDKTSVGAVYQIDMEKVLACQPDLVLINRGMNEKLIPTLEANQIPSIVIDMRSYEEVKREVKIFAEITGEKEKGEAVIKEMDEKIEGILARAPKEKRRVAILHSTSQGLSVQLDGSIAGSIAKRFGWENVAAGMTPMEKNPDAAPYSMETLVEQNPDIIFVTSMGKMDEIKKNMEKTIAESPAWQSIPAIKQGKLYYLPQDLFLLSPGLQYPEAFELMAKLVSPEVFP